MRTSVRLRLTLWYAAALAVALLAYGVFAYDMVRRDLVAGVEYQVHEDKEFAEGLLKRAEKGGVDWRAEFGRRWSPDDDDRRVLVYRRTASGPSTLLEIPKDRPGVVWRFDTAAGRLDGVDVFVDVYVSMERLRAQLDALKTVLQLGFLLGVALAALGGWLLARRALAPVGKMAERARTITASNLAERLPVENADDEFGRLATVFNETFARLESSFEQLRRFTADASHELRTPLTAIRAVGEVGLREPRSAEQYREIIGSMLEEVDRLAQLVESLLTLSRADAGRIVLKPESFDLAALARDVAGHLGVLAEEKKQRLDVDAAAPVPVTADRAILRLAVLNLVDNAVKYSPAGSDVHVLVESRDGTATLAVLDSGPGIPREHLSRVFDRFHRVDAARSREVGGAGLGLSIARWAVEAHGGRIEVRSEEGEGSTFTIVLPTRQDGHPGGAS